MEELKELESLVLQEKDLEEEEKTQEEIEELKAPVAGARYKAVIKKIVKGKYGSFFDLTRLRNELMRQKVEEYADRTAFKIVFVVEDFGIEDNNVLLYSLHPQSRFVRLMECYGGVLRVGQEVVVEYNGKYFKIECPEE